MTLVFVDPESPLTIDHKAGRVTMAFNGTGVMDADGNPLLYAEDCKHHWLENAILNDWTSGAWSDAVTYPAWEDGTPKVRSSSFVERHEYQVASLGHGLRCGWYVGQQASISTFIKEWNLLESFIGYNSHGQFVSFGIDENADITSWRRIRHVNDFGFGATRRKSGLQRENVVSGVCDWDPDFDMWRNSVITFSDADAINKYKARRKEGHTVESKILNYIADISWIVSKRLQRLKVGLTQIEITGKIDLMDVEVGDGVLLETIEGTGATGYSDRACYVLRKKLNLSSKPITVTLTLLDVHGMLAATALPQGENQVFIASNDSGSNLLISNDDDYAIAILN
jgi:hypothetical protein